MILEYALQTPAKLHGRLTVPVLIKLTDYVIPKLELAKFRPPLTVTGYSINSSINILIEKTCFFDKGYIAPFMW